MAGSVILTGSITTPQLPSKQRLTLLSWEGLEESDPEKERIRTMYLFHVPGMKCGGCASAVTRTLQSVDPTALVRVDLGKREVQVTSSNSERSLLAALAAAGYPAEPVLQHIG